MYKCKHFELHELVPRSVFEARGVKAWELLDERMLITLDLLRARYGKMTVNNWFWGGVREWSGLRIPGSPYYSVYSQHSFGRAADSLFGSVTTDEVRHDILLNETDPAFELIGSVELKVSWLHFDVRNCNRIKTYRPN